MIQTKTVYDRYLVPNKNFIMFKVKKNIILSGNFFSKFQVLQDCLKTMKTPVFLCFYCQTLVFFFFI